MTGMLMPSWDGVSASRSSRFSLLAQDHVHRPGSSATTRSASSGLAASKDASPPAGAQQPVDGCRLVAPRGKQAQEGRS